MVDRPSLDTPVVLDLHSPMFVFAEGLHTIEVDRRGIAKLTFFADQRCSSTGTIERCIIERLILPADVLEEIATRMLAARPSPAAITAEPDRRVN